VVTVTVNGHMARYIVPVDHAHKYYIDKRNALGRMRMLAGKVLRVKDVSLPSREPHNMPQDDVIRAIMKAKDVLVKGVFGIQTDRGLAHLLSRGDHCEYILIPIVLPHWPVWAVATDFSTWEMSVSFSRLPDFHNSSWVLQKLS